MATNSKHDYQTNVHGVNLLTLCPGRWIVIQMGEVCHEVGLLVDIERRASPLRNFRNFKVMVRDPLTRKFYVLHRPVLHHHVVAVLDGDISSWDYSMARAIAYSSGLL